MIYLTGDTHGGVDMHKLNSKELKKANIRLTDKDYLIITGDFGFPFTPDDLKKYEEKNGEYIFWINRMKAQPYKILFIDGNHDNHDWWSEQAVSEMFGGKVQIHPHAENVIHLMRGEIYEIEGKSFFTFGGAASVDKAYRTEGYSWWSAEEPSFEEIDRALNNLDKVGNKVDYIITHTLPEHIIWEIPSFRYIKQPCRTAQFLDTVLEKVKYDKWFCGHFHIDRVIPQRRAFVLYNTVHKLESFDTILKGNLSMYTILTKRSNST